MLNNTLYELLTVLRKEYDALSSGNYNEALLISKKKGNLSDILNTQIQKSGKIENHTEKDNIIQIVQQAKHNEELWRAVLEGTKRAREKISLLLKSPEAISVYTDKMSRKKLAAVADNYHRHL